MCVVCLSAYLSVVCGCLCVYVSVCLCGSACDVCVSVYPFMCLPVCLSVFLCLCVCSCVCVSMCLSVCICVSVCLFFCVYMSFSVCVSIFLCACVYVPVYLSVFLSVCVHTHNHTQLLKLVAGAQTQVLLFLHQALCPPNHLPGPGSETPHDILLMYTANLAASHPAQVVQ